MTSLYKDAQGADMFQQSISQVTVRLSRLMNTGLLVLAGLALPAYAAPQAPDAFMQQLSN